MTLPESGAHITFIMPMPESWSKKKKRNADGKPHRLKTRNDIDNLTKGLLDALFQEDGHIWDIKITKKWGKAGEIWIDSNR